MKPEDLSKDILILLKARFQARRDKDFARADRIRVAIRENGFEIRDMPSGEVELNGVPKWKRRKEVVI